MTIWFRTKESWEDATRDFEEFCNEEEIAFEDHPDSALINSEFKNDDSNFALNLNGTNNMVFFIYGKMHVILSSSPVHKYFDWKFSDFYANVYYEDIQFQE